MELGWRLGDLRGQRVRRPGWFVFGQCEGRSGYYVGAAAPKAWCLGGGLEICVDSEYVDPAGSSPGDAEVVLAGTSGRRPRNWRCVCCVGGCVVWMAGLLACVVFRLGFPYKPGFVWFLDPVFLINWVTLSI